MFSRPFVHILLIALLGAAVYSNTFHVPFIFDDDTSIVNNAVVRNLQGFLSGGGYDYNPRRFIGYLTFALNYRLGGMDVTGYHLFNLAVHIACALLVYYLVRLTLGTPYFGSAECGVRSAELTTESSKLKTQISNSSVIRHPSSFIALLAALLFVCHPVQTQAVTYIVQRLASLAAMFYLAALVLYVRARLFQEEGGMGGRGVFLHILSILAAVAAMKTKEIAFTLPLVTALYEFFFFKGKVGKRLLVLLPMLLTIVIIPLSLVEGEKPGGEMLADLSEKARAETVLPRWGYLITQFRVIVTYLRLLILPVNQNLDYDYPIYTSFFAPPVILSFLFLLALFGLAVYLFYQSKRGVRSAECGVRNSERLENGKFRIPNSEFRIISFGLLWFFITLSVESSVVPIADVIFEHRLYLPSAGIFVAAAVCLATLLGQYPARAYMIAIALVGILSVTAWKRNQVWGNEINLWHDTVKKSPDKARSRYNLAKALSGKGEIEQAIDQYKIVLKLKPDYVEAHNNMGVLYGRLGLLDKAQEQYQLALTLKPDHQESIKNLNDVKAMLHWNRIAEERNRKSKGTGR
ncbi:MAG: tetratricopeptide repeat protein [Geobacteraceae bacterium]|nr:tetratricopeptide repeat protein [Geobacteraceae bacterium]